MKNQSFHYFAELLKGFIDRDIVRIDWGKSNQGLKLSKTAKEKLKESEYPITEEEFAEISFEIIYICIALSAGTINIMEFEESKVDIVKSNFLTDDLKDEINIKTSSSSKVVEEFNYQILTKRNVNNPEDIITYSILLEILSNEPRLSTRDSKYLDNINLEVSEKQLRDLIKTLTQIIDNVHMLKGNERR